MQLFSVVYLRVHQERSALHIECFASCILSLGCRCMWWYHLHARTLSMYTRGPDEIGCGHAIRDGTLELLHLAGKLMPRCGTITSVGLWCEWLCARAFVHLRQCAYAGGVCVCTHSGVSVLTVFPKLSRNSPSVVESTAAAGSAESARARA